MISLQQYTEYWWKLNSSVLQERCQRALSYYPYKLGPGKPMYGLHVGFRQMPWECFQSSSYEKSQCANRLLMTVSITSSSILAYPQGTMPDLVIRISCYGFVARVLPACPSPSQGPGRGVCVCVWWGNRLHLHLFQDQNILRSLMGDFMSTSRSSHPIFANYVFWDLKQTKKCFPVQSLQNLPQGFPYKY